MKFVARLAAALAVTFLMVPSLMANDEQKPTVKKAIVSSRASTGGTAKSNVKPATLAPRPAPAQPQAGSSDVTTPKVEIFLGYSYFRAVPHSVRNRIEWTHGGNGNIAYNLNKHWGLVADVAGYHIDELLLQGTNRTLLDADGSLYTFLFGPRLSYRFKRFTPFAQVLFGLARASAVEADDCSLLPIGNCRALPWEKQFAWSAGGGLDINVNHLIAIRPIQIDDVMTRWKDPSTGTESGLHRLRNNIRISAGVVFRFGGNPPPPPPPPPNGSPTASCSVDPASVFAGSDAIVTIRVQATDPDNDTLNYSYNASGGRVDGTGAQVRWLSAGVMPGTYTITATVTDGRGGMATCTANAVVATRPNRPPTVSLNSDRDTVFVGERVHFTATASDPDNDPLTYTWRTNGGQLTAANTMGDLNTTGVAPGSYTVTVRVEDGRGGAADASKAVNVQAPPPPPQASRINGCDFKPASSARVDNVCKRILDDVALRLQNEPRANVVIIGFADPGARADRMAGSRGENTAKYLTDKGVDRSRITTRTGAGQAGAGQQNSRVDIIWVPEGATY